MPRILLACAILALGLASSRADAQLSPGALSAPHEGLDSSRSCLKCHAAGKGVARELCLSCHGLLRERIEAEAGLHAGKDYQRCETCHIEHHGRDFELVWWGETGIETFDHSQTGHFLRGAHRLDCRACHRAEKIFEPRKLLAVGKDLDRTFLGLGSDCVSCHRDPHRGQMDPLGCATCHGEERWNPAPGFDHERSAFPLTGQHREVGCSDCHATEIDNGGVWVRYRGTRANCVDCHSDPHRGRLESDCAACHGTIDWHQVDRDHFDHGLTRFPLRGLHTRVDCAGCHRSGSFRVAEFASCLSCHADTHGGQFSHRPGGGACSGCHDTGGFTPSRFDLADHEATRFPLQRAHRSVPCISCHEKVATADLVAAGWLVATPGAPSTTRLFVIEDTRCAACHADPHAGTADQYLGEIGCGSCHDGDSWKVTALALDSGEGGFDHRLTAFDLEGAHRTVSCIECHEVSGRDTGRVALSFEGAPTFCAGCHDDPHGGQFDKEFDKEFDREKVVADCRDCHSLEGWAPSLFDHNSGSAFPLQGAHAKAACGACHLRESIQGREMVRYRPLPSACSDCHGPQELGGEMVGGSGVG